MAMDLGGSSYCDVVCEEPQQEREIDDDKDQYLFVICGEIPEHASPIAHDYIDKVAKTFQEDNVEEFLKVLDQEQDVGTLRKAGFVFHPSHIMVSAIHFNAIKCTIAILEDRAPGLEGCNVNESGDWYLLESPLIYAATHFRANFVELFIEKGVSLSFPCGGGSLYSQMLPLDATLFQFLFRFKSSKFKGSPAGPVHELIFSLCEDFEKEFRTISILMIADLKNARRAIYTCAIVGKEIADYLLLAVLLYGDAVCQGLRILKSLSDDEFSDLCQRVCQNKRAKKTSVLRHFVSVEKNGAMLELFRLFRNTDFSVLGFSTPADTIRSRIQDADLYSTNFVKQNVGHVKGEKESLLKKVEHEAKKIKQKFKKDGCDEQEWRIEACWSVDSTFQREPEYQHEPNYAHDDDNIGKMIQDSEIRGSPMYDPVAVRGNWKGSIPVQGQLVNPGKPTVLRQVCCDAKMGEENVSHGMERSKFGVPKIEEYPDASDSLHDAIPPPNYEIEITNASGKGEKEMGMSPSISS